MEDDGRCWSGAEATLRLRVVRTWNGWIWRNAQVFDFLADTSKKSNKICTVLDFAVDNEEAMEISKFFVDAMNSGVSGVEFKFSYDRGIARVILSGAEDQVVDIMKKYYN